MGAATTAVIVAALGRASQVIAMLVLQIPAVQTVGVETAVEEISERNV